MRFSRLARAALVLVWVLVALYPDPGVLARSVRNVAAAQADPTAARELAARLPDDPRLIEEHVLAIPYAYDWQTWGVPWYFPTAAEALRARQGDCESRAVLLASLLTAKGIPNELRVALNHIWVDYPGKQANALENAGVEIAGRRDGELYLKLPGDVDLGQIVSDQIEITWAPMPLWRLAVLLGGVTLIPFANALTGRLAGGASAGLEPAGGLLRPAMAGSRRRRAPAPAAAARTRKATW